MARGVFGAPVANAQGVPGGISCRAVAISVGPAALAAPDAGANCGYFPRRLWTSEGSLLERVEQGANAVNEIMWTTLMRVRGRIPNPHDDWYLWHWTHTGNILRLWSAPSPNTPLGGWAEHATSLPPPPAGFSDQVSSGDIVWDPATQRLLAAPEITKGPQQAEPGLYTILLESSEGSNWRYATPTPAPILSPSFVGGAWDQHGASYTRFLRDYTGGLVRVNGKALLYYRGRRIVDADTIENAAGLARSSDLVTWVPDSRSPIFRLFPGGAHHGIGSALCPDANGAYHLVLYAAVGDNEAQPRELYLKRSTGQNPAVWDNLAGDLVLPPVRQLLDGAYYVVAPNGVHYMTYTTVVRRPDGTKLHTVQLLRGLET